MRTRITYDLEDLELEMFIAGQIKMLRGPRVEYTRFRG